MSKCDGNLLRNLNDTLKYGYQTIDAHCYNIVFDRWQPKFVDLGSFVPLEQPPERKKLSWRAYEEFLYAAWLPLKTWQQGKNELARKSLSCCGIGRHHHFLEHHGCGLLLEKWVRGVSFIFTAYKTIPALPDNLIAEFLCRTPISKKVARFIIWTKNTFYWPFSSVDLEKFCHKFRVLNKGAIAPPPVTQDMENDDSKSLGTVVSLINQYGIKTITEIGSRNRAAAKVILSKTQVREIVCIDSDESFVDASYAMIKRYHLPITPVLMDLNIISKKTAYRPPWDRFKSEAVLAMAINPLFVMTHVRSLAAGFERLSLYTCKYIFVEFISIRLYREISGCAPSDPDRCVVDWLRSIFERYFELCFERQMEPDAIVFGGRLKHKPPSMAAELKGRMRIRTPQNKDIWMVALWGPLVIYYMIGAAGLLYPSVYGYSLEVINSGIKRNPSESAWIEHPAAQARLLLCAVKKIMACFLFKKIDIVYFTCSRSRRGGL